MKFKKPSPLSCALSWDSTDRHVRTINGRAEMSHHVNRNATKELPPSLPWRTSRAQPASQFNNRYKHQPFCTTADSCQPSTHRGHLPGQGEVTGKHHCCREGTMSPLRLSPLTQAPMPGTHNQQTTCCLATLVLAKPWVNKLSVIPSAWGYSQRLARLIITPGSLPAPASEGRGASFWTTSHENGVSSFCWPSRTISKGFHGTPHPAGEKHLFTTLKSKKANN